MKYLWDYKWYYENSNKVFHMLENVVVENYGLLKVTAGYDKDFLRRSFRLHVHDRCIGSLSQVEKLGIGSSST